MVLKANDLSQWNDWMLAQMLAQRGCLALKSQQGFSMMPRQGHRMFVSCQIVWWTLSLLRSTVRPDLNQCQSG